MKLLILNGSSCSGKSTIIKNIMKQKKGIFYLSYDRLKWFFSDYKAEQYYRDIQKIILAIATSVFKMKYQVVCDWALYQSSRKKLIALAQRYNYEILEINLLADFNILAQRFDERVAQSLLSSERRISNVSRIRFKELVDIFEREKNPLAITLRTDTASIEEVTATIVKMLS